MSDFALPANRLGASGIGVAAAPTGGMGLALDDRGKVPAGALIEPWHIVGNPGEPAFNTNWSNLADQVRFRKYAFEAVEICGIATKSVLIASGDIIFTLPNGYAPGQPRRFTALASNAGTALGWFRVETNGNVTWRGGTTTAGESIALECFFSLG